MDSTAQQNFNDRQTIFQIKIYLSQQQLLLIQQMIMKKDTENQKRNTPYYFKQISIIQSKTMEHQKVLNEFEKSNEEIRGLNSEKSFLKNKINEILSRNGFDVKSFEQEESLKEGKVDQGGNDQQTKLEYGTKHEDSSMQQE